MPGGIETTMVGRSIGSGDRWWREGAAVGAAVRVEFEHNPAIPGSRQPFTVRYRSMTPFSTIEASTVARCDRAQTIRLWPAGAPGVMRGELPIGDHAECTIDAAVNEARVTRGIAVSSAPSRPADDTLAKLERQARASGGVVTDEDNLDLASLSRRSPEGAKADVHPMRSVLWLLPFVGCLSAEWWLRRRIGLR